MKRNVRMTIFFLWAFVITNLVFYPNNVGRASSNPSANYLLILEKVRSVSIKVLQQRLMDCGGGKACSKELLQLAGLKRILGYMIDEENHDILLYGCTGQGLPPLYVEDFVIALRNAWFKYAPLRGNTYEYSYPGCSIDPKPRTIQKLQRIGQKITSSSSFGQVEKALESWHQTCQERQSVRVMGIPVNTRFAQVMVKTDYDMKTIVDGTDSLDIPGLLSLTDIKLTQIRHAMLQNKPVAISAASLNRFWFYPGKNLYEEDDGIALIKQCPVKLLTEEMFLSTRGQLASGQRIDPMAQEFSKSFSKLYNKIAEVRPIYLELENLFRFVALAKIIKFTSAYEKGGLDLKYLLEDFPVSQIKVNKSLPGRSAVKEFRHRWDFDDGYQIARLWLPSCGGVSIAIQPKKNDFIQTTAGLLKRTKEKTLNARRSLNDLYWDVKQQIGGDLAKIGTSKRVSNINQANDNFTVLTVVDTRTDYEVYGGEKDPIYKGSNIPTLVRTVSAEMGKSLKNTIYFEMQNFASEAKIKAFATTAEIQLNRMKSDVTVRTLSSGDGDVNLRDAYFSTGIRFDKQSSSIEPISGNKFRLTLHFLTRVKGKIQRLTVYVITKTRSIAEQFLKKVQYYFSPQLDSPRSLLDIINEIRWELKKEHNLKDKDIDVLIQDESGRTQIVIFVGHKMEPSV